MVLDARFPPQFGGPDTLQSHAMDASPGCLGVATMLERDVYAPGKIQDVAVETWRHEVHETQVTGVKEAVVSLPTTADAEALFGGFARQWQKCDGQSVQMPDGMMRLQGQVGDVHVTASVAAATVS